MSDIKSKYNILVHYVLTELEQGTLVEELEPTIYGLISDGYLSQEDIEQAVNTYRESIKSRTSLLNAMYQDLKEGMEISYESREQAYQLEVSQKNNPRIKHTFINAAA